MDDTIVRAAIHPGIGIARVGNSDDAYFVGPELPYATPTPQEGYKDASGALKRQAAKFRIYGYNRAGQVVKELTADDAAITWTVHVANKKAAWYNFEVALDIPEAVPCMRRNSNFMGDERQQLIIDPGPRSISGKDRAATISASTLAASAVSQSTWASCAPTPTGDCCSWAVAAAPTPSSPITRRPHLPITTAGSTTHPTARSARRS